MSFPVEYMSVIIFAIGGLIWLVRLEGKILNTAEKIKDLNLQVADQGKKHDALDNRIMEKLSFIERSLAKIEGQLIRRSDEQQRD